MRGAGGLFWYGNQCTANYFNTLVQGRVSVVIGRNSLFSWGIDIRTYDSHAIIDLQSKTQINKAKNVVLEPHVWIAQDVTIMPGVTIGQGAIVGAGSIVTKSVPPRSLAAGSPARVIREQVTWSREAFPNDQQINTAVFDGGAAS